MLTASISQSSGAANAVLKTQESTLLRVTRQLQVVNGEKSRTDYLLLDTPTYSPGVRSTANQLTQIESRTPASAKTLVMMLTTSPRMIQSAASMHSSK